MRGKLFLLAGVSAFTILAQPVQAQTTNVAQASEARADDPGAGFGEIIVTAQRREQRLQDVPISISAIDASSLESAGVSGVSQLQALAPGLRFSTTIGPLNLYMRGIGTKSGDLTSESSVAVYIDGVYQPTSVANIFEFNGVERVEVLKGPQGTLFGRNATGGVVQVITKDPSFTPEMNFNVGYANYETVSASAYVSSGLTDTLAANFAVQYKDQNEGWGRNITTGQERFYSSDYSMRGKLLFTPGDATDITLAGNYINFNRQNVDKQVLGQGNLGRFEVAGDSDTEAKGESYGGSLTLTHDFGGFLIRNIAAYQKVDSFQGLDQEGSPVPSVRGDFYVTSRMISEEFHVLAPAESKFQWLAGVYYFNYDTANDPVDITGLRFGGVNNGLSLFGEADARSIAGFVQGTYPLTDRLNLTGGFRYTRDKVVYRGSVEAFNTDIVIAPEQTMKYSKNTPTWRLSFDYKFSPDVLGYVSYNRGAKSGGFSLGTAVTANVPFQPEKLDAYEAGLKTQLFDRNVTFNMAAFYYNYQNIQFQRAVAGSVITLNGPTAKAYGLEAELSGKVTPQLTLHANGNYLHTRFGDFPGAPNVNRLPSGMNGLGDPNFNAKGNRLIFAPKFSGNVGFDYRIPLDSGRIKLASNLSYNTKSYSEVDNRLVIDAYELLSASVAWEGDDGLRLSVWGNNLTNSYYNVYLSAIAGSVDVAGPAAPRTYGVSLGYSF